MLKVLNHNAFDSAFEILQSSFPVSEFRTKENQKALLGKKEYVLYGIYANEDIEKLLGILAVWRLDGFVFVEHFATQRDVRGGGIGGATLLELQAMTDGMIVLEVELPQEEMQKRRIDFYEKHGFFRNAFAYMQPPLRDGEALLPLMLMSYPKPLTESTFLNCRDVLYDVVYGYAL